MRPRAVARSFDLDPLLPRDRLQVEVPIRPSGPAPAAHLLKLSIKFLHQRRSRHRLLAQRVQKRILVVDLLLLLPPPRSALPPSFTRLALTKAPSETQRPPPKVSSNLPRKSVSDPLPRCNPHAGNLHHLLWLIQCHAFGGSRCAAKCPRPPTALATGRCSDRDCVCSVARPCVHAPSG